MNIVSRVLSLFSLYPFYVSFLGAFFGGEETILTLSYLSGQSSVSVVIVFLGCFLGTFASDVFWFYSARHAWVNALFRRKNFSKAYAKALALFGRVLDRNIFLTLLIILLLLI